LKTRVSRGFRQRPEQVPGRLEEVCIAIGRPEGIQIRRRHANRQHREAPQSTSRACSLCGANGFAEIAGRESQAEPPQRPNRRERSASAMAEIEAISGYTEIFAKAFPGERDQLPQNIG
jgi:hypothetical protein